MNLRTTTAALALALIAGTAAAREAAPLTYVRVSFLDEETPELQGEITTESKLVFKGTPYIEFSKVDGLSERVPIAGVKRISFSGNWTGVTMAKAEQVALSLRENPVGKVLSVVGYDSSKAAQLSVYSIAGREVVRVNAWKGEDIDVSQLPSGIYILRINQTTLKFVKK